MRWQLSLLMFLQYAVPGAWVPVFSLHLQELGFSQQEIAVGCSTSALGALLAPLLWGQIADRWLAAQRCISVCAFAGGLLLWFLADLTSPWGVFVVGLAFWFFMVPILSLGAAYTFRQLPHPERQYGPVRMWGTVGWVAASWLLGHWFGDPTYWRTLLSWLRPGHPRSELPDALRLGGSIAFVLGLYAFTLPSAPPTARSPAAAQRPAGWLSAVLDAPLLALRLFRQRSLLILAACIAGLYVTVPFSGQMTPLLLKQRGVSAEWLPAVLTIAQSLEIVGLALLPVILLKFEEKGAMALGILAWATALGVLTLGQPLWLVIASLGLHGLFITCFLVAGQVYVNRRAGPDIRASAQGVLQFINGCGLLSGHMLVGVIRQAAGHDFTLAFAPAATLTAVLFVVFVLGFRTARDAPPTAAEGGAAGHAER